MKDYKRLLYIVGYLAFVHYGNANNISVTNVHLVSRDISAGSNNSANFVYVKCDISWDNSWRTSSAPNNWDAAWIFVKYRVGSGSWSHATLHTTGHREPSGSTLAVSSGGKGIFIYRSASDTVSGSVNFTGAQLRWNYGADGVADSSQVTIKVFGIEMVSVPTDSFYVGSGGQEPGCFTDGSWISGNGVIFKIQSENSITIAQSAGSLWGISSNPGLDDIGPTGTLSANFPKGYSAFYCMKYSISQEQYIAFLNTLTYDQQATRTAVSPSSSSGTLAMTTGSSDRSGIRIQTSGVASTTPAVYGCDLNNNGTFAEIDDGQNVSCNWLSWADGIAYSDWATIRPMTELEFEKACRGPNVPMQYEYVWGNSTVTTPTGISNSGRASEAILPDTANANYNNHLGVPVRVGAFAKSTSTRLLSGAAYYGMMDLGGDVLERVVTVGNTTGRSFAGTHGDGSLNSTGDATGNSDWPGTDAVGAGFRGGPWDSSSDYMRISDRYISALTSSSRGSLGTRGFRGVRTAP